VTNAKAAKSVIENFWEKYGAKDVKKYYSKLDVAVVVELVTRQGSRTSIAIPVSSTAKPAIRLGNALSLILPRLD
jgi:predicted metal-dependent hydrolase